MFAGDLILITQVITFWEPLCLNNVYPAQSLLLSFFLLKDSIITYSCVKFPKTEATDSC